MELVANRDPSYPFTADYWMQLFAVPRLQISKVDSPTMQARVSDLKITVKTAEIIYPEITPVPNKSGDVEVKIVGGRVDITAKGILTKAGEFVVKFDKKDLLGLEPNTYTILVSASYPGAIPASKSSSIILY